MNQKYADLIAWLIDDQIYSGTTIASLALKRWPGLERIQLFRIRLAMNCCAQAYLPKNADGLLSLPGKDRVPGWFGWRWKQIWQRDQTGVCI